MRYSAEREEIIKWAHLLYEKNFTLARSGNISQKLPCGEILITAHNSYLGFLKREDILLIDLEGNILEGDKEITSEKVLHLDIHKSFKNIKVVLHTHPSYTTAFYNYFKNIDYFSYEAKFYLGKVAVIPQQTPTVVDTKPIIEALGTTNIVVLKNHGVVSVGEDFLSAFSLAELLEEQAKVSFLIKSKKIKEDFSVSEDKPSSSVKYKLLSEEHIKKLVEVINNDKEVQELGKKYNLTCTLAVEDKDTGSCVCFYYEKGKIIKVENHTNAEFVIVGDTAILKKVFNRQIDPFVASTQGKVKTKGDFSKMSKWYPVLVRTFKLWEKAPVE